MLLSVVENCTPVCVKRLIESCFLFFQQEDVYNMMERNDSPVAYNGTTPGPDSEPDNTNTNPVEQEN